MCYELWSTSAAFDKKFLLVVFCFVFFAEWVHSPPHSCSLWEYQCSHVAVKSGCCCGLHRKGKCGLCFICFITTWQQLLHRGVRGTLLSPAEGPDLAGLVLSPPGVKGLSLGRWTEPELETSPLKTSVLIKRGCYFRSSKTWAGIQWHRCFHL